VRIKFNRQARSSPESIGHMQVPYAAARRVASRWRWYLVLALVFGPLALIGASAIGGFMVTSANGSVTLDPLEVRAGASGYVDSIAYKLGAVVPRGAEVLALRDPELDAQEAQLRLQVVPYATPVAADNTAARAAGMEELRLRTSALRHQQQRRATILGLKEQGAATVAELNEVTAAVEQAEATVIRLRAELGLGVERDAAHAGGRAAAASSGSGAAGPANAATSVALTAHDGDLAVMAARRSGLTVLAPRDGQVIDVLVSEGQYVAAGQSLMVIGDPSSAHIEAFVTPGVATRLQVGRRATIRFPDGRVATATVGEQPKLTRRLPENLVDQYGLRPMTVVLQLAAQGPWPEGQRIHGLPVQVRFHAGWESNPVGAALGRVLGWISGTG
jgi:multidrug resistance efflux pump